MEKIEETRQRLTALTLDEVALSGASPVESLATCRSLQDRLQKLKLDVLAEILALRDQAEERADRSRRGKPVVGDLPERRAVGARRLLKTVGQRVKRLVTNRNADAVEAWRKINREIDARLERLEEIERRLERAARRSSTNGIPSLPDHGARSRDEEEDDDALYAAVGAEVKKGKRRGPFCAHCGHSVRSEDRFCAQCGHRRL